MCQYEIHYSDSSGKKWVTIIAPPLFHRPSNDQEAITDYCNLRRNASQCRDWRLYKVSGKGDVRLLAANEM